MGEGIKVEAFQIPKSDPLTLSTENREEMEAVAAGIVSLVIENADGESYFGGMVRRVQDDGMTMEAIMIKGLLAQKAGRVPRGILGTMKLGTPPETNVVPFTGRRKRNRTE